MSDYAAGARRRHSKYFEKRVGEASPSLKDDFMSTQPIVKQMLIN
jgi:hypothetical protein